MITPKQRSSRAPFEVHINNRGKTCMVFQSSLADLDDAFQKASQDFLTSKSRRRTPDAFDRWLSKRLRRMVTALHQVEDSAGDHDLMRDIFVTSAITVLLDRTANKNSYRAAVVDILDDHGHYTVDLFEKVPSIQVEQNERLIIQGVDIDPCDPSNDSPDKSAASQHQEKTSPAVSFFAMTPDEVRNFIAASMIAEIEQGLLGSWQELRARSIRDSSDIIIQFLMEEEESASYSLHFPIESLTLEKFENIKKVYEQLISSECTYDREQGWVIFNPSWAAFIGNELQDNGEFVVFFKDVDGDLYDTLVTYKKDLDRIPVH